MHKVMDVYIGGWMHRWVHFGNDELSLQPGQPPSVILQGIALASLHDQPAPGPCPLACTFAWCLHSVG